MSSTQLTRLSAEIHSSAHQVRFDNSVVGEFEVRMYRGTNGPVVILDEGSSSPMPLEYLSEFAVTRFLDQVPNSLARFFERHIVGNHEVFVEVGFEAGIFTRRACQFNDVVDAVAVGDGDSGQVGQDARIGTPFAAPRRH